AGEVMFHAGWFVESLATQTLVLFVIRTMGNPFRSRPSLALTITTLVITGIGVSLPWTPLAPALGFSPLPWAYVAFLVTVSAAYLAVVEAAKRRLVRHESSSERGR
ncbi:MAG: cation transporting ATPase C-terminal domain-containing protein, partial [Vicinamibacterales bacterium]